jgi:hypothetical protein
MSNNTLIVCSVLVVCLKTGMEQTRYNVQDVSDGRTHFVLVWRKNLLVRLVRDKHCFVLSLYPLYLYFFTYSVTILCTFFVNYLPPHIRCTHLPILGTRMRLIWGDEAFTEMNFTHPFSFHNVLRLCRNCLFSNQMKLFLCFEMFYIFLSLMQV